ncbi:MAG: hypothetical protein ACI8R6_000471 [Candidatus Paceibacteria bacterium]|jgi:hypothetical protein
MKKNNVKPKGALAWLIKNGIVTDINSANVILLVSSMIFIGATIAVISNDSVRPITEEEIQTINSQLSPDDPFYLE